MKRYLNKAEKNELSVLLNMQAFLNKQVALRKSLNRKTRWLSTSSTFLTKAVKDILEELDEHETRVALKNYSKLKLVLKTSQEAIADVKKLQEEDKIVPLDNDDFLILASFALNSCSKCMYNEFTTCSLRRIFVEYEIEPMCLETDGCQYNFNMLQENGCFDLYEVNGTLLRVQPGLDVDWKLIQKAPLPEKYWSCLKVTV